jgi:hypothetical protein
MRTIRRINGLGALPALWIGVMVESLTAITVSA